MKRLHRCCFSGHRAEKLSSSPDAIKDWLRSQITAAIADGYVTFITGMGMGVDLWAAQIILSLRESDDRIHLIAVRPYMSFASRWNPSWRETYRSVWTSADYTHTIASRYTADCLETRNRWMIDHSHRLIAFYNGEAGGTHDMIAYAENHGVETIIRIDK